MSFRDNLLHLRASKNMTQEQLAMLLGVSRQSVTKWESGKSSPEMDKLLGMCQIFDCTLDELVQGDMTNRPMEAPAAGATPKPPSDVCGYDEFMRRFANKISNGVMSILLGIAVALVFFVMSDAGMQSTATSGFPSAPLAPSPQDLNAIDALEIVCVLAGIAIGLSLIIPAGIAYSHFVREHPFIEDFYTSEEKLRARESFTRQLMAGILLILFAVAVVVIVSALSERMGEMVGIPCMMVLIALGVRYIIHGGMTLGRVNVGDYNDKAAEVLSAHEIASAEVSSARKEEMMRNHRQDKMIGAICGTIMIVATAIALMMLFLPLANGADAGTFAYFWLPWPIGGLLCGVVTLLIKGFAQDE